MKLLLGRVLKLTLLVTLTFWSALEARAQIDCDQATLQKAVNAASGNSKTTIKCNPGSWTWTTPVSYSNKSIVLDGTGVTITSDTNGKSPLTMDLRRTDTVEVFGFTWKMQTTVGGGGYIYPATTDVGNPPVAVHLHHMTMYGDPLDGVSYGGRYIMVSDLYGLIDHIRMISTTTRTAGNISMQQDSAVSTSYTYHSPQTLGDANALYIEDCDFEFASVAANLGNGAIDMYAGVRWVARHNTIRNNNVGNHGFDSQPRGTRSFEVYQNTFIADPGAHDINMFQPRSGTGVVWGNTVKNVSGVNRGYVSFFEPQLYGGVNAAELAASGAAWYNQRANAYHPTGPWRSFNGVSGPVNSPDTNNLATGANPLDGNQQGPGHFDPTTTRTVADLVTTAGSKTITSATANFTRADLVKSVAAANFTPGRVLTNVRTTKGSTTVTAAAGNFTAGDIGRPLSSDDRSTIIKNVGDAQCASKANGHLNSIASVTNSTTAVLAYPSCATSTNVVLIMLDPYVVSIVDSKTAVMSTQATASSSGGTLSIGFLDQGYPLLDQPGRGSFPAANPGNWPRVTKGYSEANYEALDPMYLFLNHWQTVDRSMKVLSDTHPPATTPAFTSTAGYLKHLREWYDDTDVATDIFANIPATCTVGAGYWATDKGGDWDKTNNSANDGALYRCTSSNHWDLYYTPYTYPHPLQGTSSTTPQARPGNPR